jgi:putative endonuclease
VAERFLLEPILEKLALVDESLHQRHWCVYMVRCIDGSLYTGITTDPTRRLAEHNGSTRGARYTRTRRPVSFVYLSSWPDRSSASRHEWKIKQMCRTAKESLITSRAVDLAKRYI